MAEILSIRRKTQSMKTKEARSILTAEGLGVFFVMVYVHQNVCSFFIPFFSTFEKFFNTLTEKNL